MKISTMTLSQLKKELEKGTLTSVQVIEAFKKEYEEDLKNERPLNAFIEFFDDALQKAKEADDIRRNGSGFDTKPLLGLPIAIKDNISMKGKLCTCCSHSLEGYIAPYNSTVIQRLVDAGAIITGRTNMDEMAMGSSTEYSCYGPSLNPIDRNRTPGGSSGGSASVVAGNQCPFSLGSETGGSVRLPASYCGVYGLKPTYGLLSRYGVVAFASSLDQVGLFSKEASDIALILSVLAGKDINDDTSADIDFSDLKELTAMPKSEILNSKFLLIKEFMEADGLNPEVRDIVMSVAEWLKTCGGIVNTISIPILNASIADYYVIALAEAASNLSRIDGIRYGHRIDPEKGYDELYNASRSHGFGPEVKRRILTGNYALTKEFSGNLYEKASNVRAGIEKAIMDVLNTNDFIIAPTGSTPAFKIGEKINDPIAMYLSDFFTSFANLSRVPSLSVPAGATKKDNLPIGVQFCSKQFAEKNILRLAKAWEER